MIGIVERNKIVFIWRKWQFIVWVVLWGIAGRWCKSGGKKNLRVSKKWTRTDFISHYIPYWCHNDVFFFSHLKLRFLWTNRRQKTNCSFIVSVDFLILIQLPVEKMYLRNFIILLRRRSIFRRLNFTSQFPSQYSNLINLFNKFKQSSVSNPRSAEESAWNELYELYLKSKSEIRPSMAVIWIIYSTRVQPMIIWLQGTRTGRNKNRSCVSNI